MNEVHWIGAVDGLELGATLFHPTRAARGTVIVNGATGVPASYYSSFAEHLAASGLRVVTYDYRGVGASRPDSLRGFSATMSDWAELDARSVLGHVRERFGDSPLFWLGHSFGGQALGLIDDAREVTGAVLVGSQLGDLSFWPLPDRLKLSVLLGGLLPAVTRGFGYLPGAIGVGEDLPKGVAEEWARWCLTRGYFLEAHPVARRRFARFDKPTLLYSMSDDDFAPEPAVAQLMALLSSAPLEHRRVNPERARGRGDWPLRLLPTALHRHVVARGPLVLRRPDRRAARLPAAAGAGALEPGRRRRRARSGLWPGMSCPGFFR